ncbi:MAG: hypothetical protein HQL43_00875 [Alphaproteobacteria bacterium]|nr:hypothetical protein [Alphaproteobacteria bacterium]
MSDWFIRKNWAQDVFNRHDSLLPHKDSDFYALRSDVFLRTEPWLAEYFGFAEAERRLGEDARPFRHLACIYISTRYSIMQILHHISQNDSGCVVGLEPETAALYQAYYGQALSLPTRDAVRLTVLINTLLWLAFTVAGLLWLLARLGRTAEAQTWHLGCDFAADPRDVDLWKKAMGNRASEVLILLRNRAQEIDARRLLPPFAWTNLDQSQISLAHAPGLVLLLLRRATALLPRLTSLPPTLFYMLAALPWRRVQTRALLLINHFTYFWGRDDYNVEHILRNQELRKMGGQSIGINHGIDVCSLVSPQWRHIDFDTYFVFGRHHYQKYCKAAWPAKMQVIPVGSFGRQIPKDMRCDSQDIMVLVSIDPANARIVQTILALSAAFPMRRILVKLKHRREQVITQIVEPLADAPSNVVLTDGDFYELLKEVRYVFGTATTAVAEAIQYGKFSFALDYYEAEQPFLYRDFPDMIVDSAETAINRIRGIEDGRWRYPRERFAELIELDPEPFIDAFSRAIGLSTKSAHA